jgi:hypothetical protein
MLRQNKRRRKLALELGFENRGEMVEFEQFEGLEDV